MNEEVIGISCQCMTCNHRFSKKYDPPIAWELFMEQRGRHEILCEKCNTPCKSIAHFEEEEQTSNATNGSARPALTGKVAILVQDASEDIMEKYRFLTIEETDEVLVYDNGVYRPGGKTLIAKELEAVYGYELNTHSLSQITGHIMRRTYHKHEELDADINIINLKNGLYDIEKDVLLPHNPEYLSVKQKPITYDEDAKPELFLKFISEIVYEQDIQTAIDIIAYTFRRDYDIEVIFKLYGLGNNGKTVYTSLISALHGPDSISNVPLSEMLGSNKDKFASSDLEGKDVNIDNELGGQTIKETAMLKRLTGGSRQPTRIQRKNERAFDTILWAKLIFNVNTMPDSADKSDAYNRRLIIVAFPYRFEGEAEDKQLTHKLTTEKEMSGIFNILMDALRRIVKTREIYVNEKTIEERRAKYDRTVNTLQSFYDEMISEYSEPEHHIPKEEFHTVYVKYCQKYSIPHEKYDIFCKNVKNKLQLKESKPEIESQRVHCWKGALWKGKEKLYDCPKCDNRNTDASAITMHLTQDHPIL